MRLERWTRRDLLRSIALGATPVQYSKAVDPDPTLTDRRTFTCLAAHAAISRISAVEVHYVPDRNRSRSHMVFRVYGGPNRHIQESQLQSIAADVGKTFGLLISFVADPCTVRTEFSPAFSPT